MYMVECSLHFLISFDVLYTTYIALEETEGCSSDNLVETQLLLILLDNTYP